MERPFTLAIHAESSRFGLTARNAISSNLAHAVNNILISSYGVQKTYGHCQLFQYYEANSGIYTFGAQNTS
jgi:hypothetical protein